MKKSPVLLLATALFAPVAFGAATATDGASGRLPEVSTTAPAPGSGSGLYSTGAYNQPGWTKRRRFATTRAYIQRDPWEVAFESWWRIRTYDGGEKRHKFMEEIEIGLPYRFQLDLYYDFVHEGGDTDFLDFAAELRWALADWDVIPLNPTLYAEYKWTDDDMGPDVVEAKLLLSDDIGEHWQWAANFIYEAEVSGERTVELQFVTGLSYTINEAISVGAEFKYNRETVAGHRSDPEHKVLLGPSIQIRPTHNTHLDLVGLFGLTDEAPNFEGYVVFGVDFDFGHPGEKRVGRPVSGAR